MYISRSGLYQLIFLSKLKFIDKIHLCYLMHCSVLHGNFKAGTCVAHWNMIQKLPSDFLYTSTGWGLSYIKKISSVMSFTFNAVELYVVTINEKLWATAREQCRTLRYEKAARRIVRHHFTIENIQHKHQLESVSTVGTTVNWPRDLQN